MIFSIVSLILELFKIILTLYTYVVIAQVIISWLVAFNVINTSNQFVYSVGSFLHQITEPVFKPLRRILPNMGGLDFTPIVVLLGIWFLQNLLTIFQRSLAGF